MALEDLTGTNKYVSALNAAWPVDDDWVDEGDNHIRGIKNVLKNSFPATDGAVYWGSAQARFPDGNVDAPGMSWVADPDTGWYRGAGGSVTYGIDKEPRFAVSVQTLTSVVGVGGASWQMRGSSGGSQPGVELTALTPDSAVALGRINVFASSYGPPAVAVMGFGVARGASATDNDFLMGRNNSNHPQFTVNGGFNGAAVDYAQSPLMVTSPAGAVPGIGLRVAGGITWSLKLAPDSALLAGTSAGGGPAGMGGVSLVVTPDGVLYAKAFNAVAALVRTNERALAGALSKVLQLRGARYFDPEAARDDIGLALVDVAQAFPEAVIGGSGINCMALVAALVEAVRELEARVRLLEARVAGS